MTYTQYRTKLSKLSDYYQMCYRERGATDWATRYWRKEKIRLRDSYPEHFRRHSLEVLMPSKLEEQ